MITNDRQLRADTVVAWMAGQIEDGAVVATGVASPLAILAIAVARATHAPNLTYVACVGSLDPVLSHLHPSSEDLAYLDGRCAEITPSPICSITPGAVASTSSSSAPPRSTVTGGPTCRLPATCGSPR